MLNRLTHRIQEAFSVLLGKKKAIPNKIKSSFPEQNYKNLKSFIIEDEKLKDYLKNISIEFSTEQSGQARAIIIFTKKILPKRYIYCIFRL